MCVCGVLVANPACDQGGHMPTLNFEKNTLPRYISSQNLNILQNSYFVVSPSSPFCFGSSLCCSFFPLLFIFLWLFFFTIIFLLLLIYGQDQPFIFNCQPTQLPSLLFILLQPLDAPPHSFHFLHFLHFAFYFFDGMPFCFSVFIID